MLRQSMIVINSTGFKSTIAIKKNLKQYNTRITTANVQKKIKSEIPGCTY